MKARLSLLVMLVRFSAHLIRARSPSRITLAVRQESAEETYCRKEIGLMEQTCRSAVNNPVYIVFAIYGRVITRTYVCVLDDI